MAAGYLAEQAPATTCFHHYHPYHQVHVFSAVYSFYHCRYYSHWVISQWHVNILSAISAMKSWTRIKSVINNKSQIQSEKTRLYTNWTTNTTAVTKMDCHDKTDNWMTPFSNNKTCLVALYLSLPRLRRYQKGKTGLDLGPVFPQQINLPLI